VRDLLARKKEDVRARRRWPSSATVKQAIARSRRPGRAGCVVFSGGIGENAAEIRARIVDGLDFLGVELDQNRNGVHGDVITRKGSRSPFASFGPTRKARSRARRWRCYGHEGREQALLLRMDAWCGRELSLVGQIYLYGNPLLKRSSSPSTSSPGSSAWGHAGLNFIYTTSTRDRRTRLNMIYIAGRDTVGPGIVANVYLEAPTPSSIQASRRTRKA